MSTMGQDSAHAKVGLPLLNAKMGVDGGITGRPCEVLVLSVGNVGTGPVVTVLLGQTKVNEEKLVAVSTNTHQEVIW